MSPETKWRQWLIKKCESPALWSWAWRSLQWNFCTSEIPAGPEEATLCLESHLAWLFPLPWTCFFSTLPVLLGACVQWLTFISNLTVWPVSGEAALSHPPHYQELLNLHHMPWHMCFWVLVVGKNSEDDDDGNNDDEEEEEEDFWSQLSHHVIVWS